MITEPQSYYDEETGVLLAVFRDEHGTFQKKRVFFSHRTEIVAVTDAITRLEDRAFPDEIEVKP
jgi:hypothetical protein